VYDRLGRSQAPTSIEPEFEAFLGGREVPPEVRPEMLASWRRSWLSGLSPETDLADVPFNLEFDRESRLVRAARPVLDHLAETLSDTTTSIILTDAGARILDRWVGAESLHAMFDRVSAAPGALYDETTAGTNGLGTAVEERRVAQVLGPDHFVETLRCFTCIGVPLRHPVTGGLEGVLDITCRYQDTNALLYHHRRRRPTETDDRSFWGGTRRDRSMAKFCGPSCERKTLRQQAELKNNCAATPQLWRAPHGLLAKMSPAPSADPWAYSMMRWRRPGQPGGPLNEVRPLHYVSDAGEGDAARHGVQAREEAGLSDASSGGLKCSSQTGRGRGRRRPPGPYDLALTSARAAMIRLRRRGSDCPPALRRAVHDTNRPETDIAAHLGRPALTVIPRPHTERHGTSRRPHRAQRQRPH
jgi:hypothetical protein